MAERGCVVSLRDALSLRMQTFGRARGGLSSTLLLKLMVPTVIRYGKEDAEGDDELESTRDSSPVAQSVRRVGTAARFLNRQQHLDRHPFSVTFVVDFGLH